MDYDLFVRFMAAGRFVRVGRVLGAFRQHDEAKTTQQLQTIGRDEIERIQKSAGMRFNRRDRWIGRSFWYGMHLRSALHCRHRRRVPGALPGIGWNYDQVWGGMLSDVRVPPV